MKNLFFILILITINTFDKKLNAQKKNQLEKFSIKTDNYRDGQLKKHLLPALKNSQFILLGESHGIVEVGEITDWLHSLSQPFAFNNLIIETDPLAARILNGFHKSRAPLTDALYLEEKYPWSIPFYNNHEDYTMFYNIAYRNANFYGIDYTLMSGFRIAFHHIIENTTNTKLKNRLKTELDKAIKGYNEAVTTKNFSKAYIFSYTEELHKELCNLTKEDKELIILKDLWKTKKVNDFQFSGQYYYSNKTRADVMKFNFMNFYNAEKKKTQLPKAIFKLGYNHTGRGLTFTNIFDIGNLASEIAESNQKRSIHILASGVSGKQNRANPVQPENTALEIKESKYIPKEFTDLAKQNDKKYIIIKTEEMRPIAHQFSSKVKKFIFKFDLIILINDAKPLTSFGLNK